MITLLIQHVNPPHNRYDLATGEKVFINICTSEHLGKPAMKKKLDDNGVEQEGMNIPLSLGEKRECTDKK